MNALSLEIDLSSLPSLKNVSEQPTFEMLTKYLIFNLKEMFGEYKKLYLFLWPKYGLERNLKIILR